MKKLLLVGAGMVCALAGDFSQPRELKLRTDVPLDSIRLSDPVILADNQTNTSHGRYRRVAMVKRRFGKTDRPIPGYPARSRGTGW